MTADVDNFDSDLACIRNENWF